MYNKQTAWQRFTDADWAGARDAFTAALEEDAGDHEALDGLGRALWWLGLEVAWARGSAGVGAGALTGSSAP